jgi:hypothetical protein
MVGMVVLDLRAGVHGDLVVMLLVMMWMVVMVVVVMAVVD